MTKLPPIQDDFDEGPVKPSESSSFGESFFAEEEAKRAEVRVTEANKAAETAALELPAEQVNEKRRFRLIRENFECLAIAVLLALIIRHYVFEPFQIPTGSMATTLLGKHNMFECEHCSWSWAVNEDVSRHPEACPHCRQTLGEKVPSLWNGEKILANKMVYHFRDPRRWESCVFRPPHKNHVNFIKRIISTGGEKIMIHNGDVFVNGTISSKPRHVQDQIWIPVYDSAHDIPSSQFFEFRRKSRDGDKKDDGGWERKHSRGRNARYSFVDLKDSFTYSMIWSRSEGESSGGDILGTRSEIPSWLSYNDNESGRIVGDLRIDATVKLAESAKGRVSFEIRDGLQTFRLELGDVNRVVHLRHKADVKTYDLDITLGSGSSHDVLFANWDNHLLVEVDGVVLLDTQAESAPEDADGDAGTFSIMARNSDLSVSKLKVWRDIHYKAYEDRTSHNNKREWDVPEGKLLVLGDNTDSSNDSRGWGFVPRENLKGRPWLRLLHVDLGRLTDIDWDQVAFGNVE